jgi:hypothetical protein
MAENNDPFDPNDPVGWMRRRAVNQDAAKKMSDAEVILTYYDNVWRPKGATLVDFLNSTGIDRRGLLGQFTSRKDPVYKQTLEWLAVPGVNETPEDAARRFGGVIKNKKDEDDYVLGLARSMFKGLTLNSGEEATSALLAARDIALNGADPSEFGQRYEAYINDERARRREFERVHPLEAGSVQLVSSVLPSLATSGFVGMAANPWVRAAFTGAVGGTEAYMYGAGERNLGVPDPEISAEQAHQLGMQFVPGGVGAGILAVPIGQAGRSMIAPGGPPNPYVIEDAAYLRRQGVTSLPAGKAAGASGLTNLERSAAPNAFVKRMNETSTQLTQAALRQTGIQNLADLWEAAGVKNDAWRLRPEDLTNVRQSNLDRLHNVLSEQYTAFGQNAKATLDGQLMTDLQDAINNYRRLATGSEVPAALTDARDKLRKLLKSGATEIPGDLYVSLRSELGKDVQRTRLSDPNLSFALRDAQMALDKGLHRWVSASSDPEIQALAPISEQLRASYRKLAVIEDAAAVDQASAAKGILTPEALSVGAQQNNLRGLVRGQNDYSRLSEAALSVLGKEDADLMANMRRQAVTGDALSAVIPGATAAGISYTLAQDPQQALQLATLAGLTGYGVKKAAQGFVGSKFGQGVLEDIALAGTRTPPSPLFRQGLPRANPLEAAIYAATLPAVTQGRQTFGPALGINVPVRSPIPAENLGTAGIPLPDENLRKK